jgi:hypothetical protein
MVDDELPVQADFHLSGFAPATPIHLSCALHFVEQEDAVGAGPRLENRKIPSHEQILGQ